MSNKVYDAAKWVALIALPAAGTLYYALALIWGFPEADKVVGSVTAVDAFLGVVLGLAARSYNNSEAKYDGTLHVDETDTSIIHQLELTTPPEELSKKDDVIFKLSPKHVKPYDA